MDIFIFAGSVDNNTVAARYRGSLGGKIIQDGKKKEESFGMLIKQICMISYMI